MTSPPAPLRRSLPARGNATLGVVAFLGVAAAVGAYVLGRSAGAAGERETLRVEQAAELGASQREVALLEQLRDKQAEALQQLQRLVEVTEAAAEAKVQVAVGLRESVELASTLLLMEAREGLAPLGRLDVVERAARVALEPYEGRESEALAPASLEVKTAATTLLADVLLEQGRLGEAHEAGRQALALALLRQRAKPDVASRRFAVARAHKTLARSLEEGADFGGALTERLEELKVLRAMSDADPAELLYLGELADALGRLSTTLAALGNGAEARAHAEEAVTIARGLRSKEPEDPRWTRVLARALGALAPRQGNGREGAALAAYDEAITLLEPAGGGQDTDASRAAERADLLLARGEADLAAGRAQDAIVALREALDAAVDVVAREPLARAGQERLAHVCTSLAAALEAGGEAEDALRGRSEAVAAWRRVSELDPRRELPKHELLHALLAWGDIYTRQQRPAEALSAYYESLALVTSLEADALAAEAAPGGTPGAMGAGRRPPLHPATGSDLAECHDRVASTLLALGRRLEALAAWRKALEAIEPLAKKTPENAFWQADLARIWMNLGQALIASEPDRKEGESALKRALRLLTALEEGGRLPGYARPWLVAMRTGAGGR